VTHSESLSMDRRLWLQAMLSGMALAPVSSAWSSPSQVMWPELKLLDGSVLPPEAWQDMAAVVVFWATWCPYCQRHNPRVEKLHQSTAGQRLRVLGVVLDGTPQSVQHYMQVNGLHFPVVVGQPSLRDRFTSRRVIPMTCAVDRRGRLVSSIPGEMSEEDLLSLGKLAI